MAAGSRQAGWTSWHNLCVRRVESAKRSYNSIHCNSKGAPNVEGGVGAVQVLDGGSSFNCAIAACFTSTHSAPTPTAHTAFTLVWHIHAPNRHKSQLLHTLPRKLRPTNARAGTYSPASQDLSLSPSPQTLSLYTFSYAKCCLSAYAGKRERERRGERGSRNVCLQNFWVLFVICDFRPWFHLFNCLVNVELVLCAWSVDIFHNDVPTHIYIHVYIIYMCAIYICAHFQLKTFGTIADKTSMLFLYACFHYLLYIFSLPSKHFNCTVWHILRN